MDQPTRDVLEEIYTTPNQPGSFTSAGKLRKAIKKVKNIDTDAKAVQQWLSEKDTYTKYRPARRNFKRNPIIATGIDQQWQGDLAEVGNLVPFNDGVRFLLVLIDVVSKFLWVEPMKSKHGKSVIDAFERVFSKTARQPKKLQTDDGKEFWDGGVQTYLKKKNIEFFTLKSDKKAAIAERVIRTLKEKIHRYLHEKHTNKFIDVLPDLVSSYNNTYHESLRMTPSEVKESNEGLILARLYGEKWGKVKKPKLSRGDKVRISRVKGPFKKGYVGNWTEEMFIVKSVVKASPYPMYKLTDWDGEEIKGSFYDHEVQKVHETPDRVWKIEKIVQKKRFRGRWKYLVKWEGYPDSLNSWVFDKDIKKLGH